MEAGARAASMSVGPSAQVGSDYRMLSFSQLLALIPLTPPRSTAPQVVISQGVLTRASAELTMSQAEAIADNTLVYTVQSTMWALRCAKSVSYSAVV